MRQSTVMKRLGFCENVVNYNGVRHQYLHTYENGVVFQSYESIIAVKLNDEEGRVYLGQDWDYSVTTGKYRNMFTGCNKAETESRIKAGLYILMEA